MDFFNENIKKEVKEQLNKLEDDVQLIYFSQKVDCQFCEEVKKLLSELSALSNKLKFVEYNFQNDRSKAEELGIDKVPGIVVKKQDEDYGIKFYGIPSGYEFASLMHSLLLVSNGKHDLKDNLVEKIKNIDKSVHIQVFVTPTCPYCPAAVVNAHKMAYLSDKITADMIEASEFPDMSTKFSVSGVPKTVINNEKSFTGAYPINDLISEVEKALC